MRIHLLNVYRKYNQKLTALQIIKQIGACFIFGICLGVLAKFSDTVPANGGTGMFFSYISDITTSLGIWVFLATFIAVRSRGPIYAGLNVFTFFVGMLLAYYTYSQVLFGFFPTYYFLRWGAIALVSPIAAYLVWFSKGEGWGAAFCAALPIGLLLAQGYAFYYVFSFDLGFNIIAAILLLVSLAKTKVQQYVRVLTFSILIAFILRNSDILAYLFGGL